MSSLPTRMSLYQVRAWCSEKLEKGITSSGTGVKHRCELWCGCWELYPGPLKEWLVLQLLQYVSSRRKDLAHSS